MVASTTIRLKGLGKKKLAELSSKSANLGVTLEDYLLELIRQDLELDHRARTMTFAAILGPGQEIQDDEAFDTLVEAAREKRHRRTNKRIARA